MSTPQKASSERRATLLQIGAKVAKSIATILEPDELLNKAVKIISEEYDFYYSGVFLLDASKKNAVLKAGYGDAGKAMLAENHSLTVGGDSMIGAAVANREARIALDVGEEAVFFENPHLPDTRSEMALPLITGEEVFGALTVQSTNRAAFTEEDIVSLQSMADQLAVALENAQLHQQAERRAGLFKAANEVGHKLATVLDLGTLLPRTVDVICEAYGFYYAGVFLLDAAGNNAVLRAGHGEAGQAMLSASHQLVVGGDSMIGSAIANREARIALDVGEEAVFFKNPHLPDTRSEMALPLIVGNAVLGAVTVQSTEEAAFSEDDITTLQTMADHLAIAIHNAYLVIELERTHQALLRTKTYEALATSTTQAIHWIGNKALPITTTIARLKDELEDEEIDRASIKEDLELIEESTQLILGVKETLIGPAIEHQLRPALAADVVQAAAFHTAVPEDILTITLAPDTPMVFTDTSQLARALSYLMQNAMESGGTHISANVCATLDGTHVAISIADDGKGISAEVREKIWAAFFTTKSAQHSGLGLSAALQIITRLDGRITVDSEPDHGAVFTIVLPAAADDETIDVSHAPDHIFFVDEDDDPWALFAANVLKLAGKDVIVQGSPAGAANADLILIDEALTTVHVEEVINELKEAGIAEKAIVVTAWLSVERATKYISMGVKDVVLKPYTYAGLAAFLNFEMTDPVDQEAGQGSDDAE
jgi:GAF domain-containing protein